MTASARERWFPGDGEVPALMRDVDWAATPLGPVERWPDALRTTVRNMLSSRFAMWMGWGPSLFMFYNDAYRRDTLGKKHPRALGRPASEVWSEIWAEIGGRVDSVLRGGGATWDEGLMLFLERSGYREETYHTFSYSPIHDDDGKVQGLLCVVVEDTARLISERRVALLGRLASELGGASTEGGVFAALSRALAAEPRDLPFTLTYLVDDEGQARLATATGFGDDGPEARLAAPERWPIADVVETARPLEVTLAGEGWPRGPWPTAAQSAYLVPLAGQGRTAGVLVAGVNPHRAFDPSFREFVTLFAGQLAGGIASARAYEHERQRAQALAELDRAKTTFFSNVSHEFRTPLTLMLGPLGGLVADEDLPPALRTELETIHRNGLRLLKLVNTMLDFSRIEAGRATALFRAVDLAQLTADLASVFRAATERAGLSLVVDCPPLPAPVPVDRDMWEKIVLNLLSNAFKFTLAGEIRVALARRGERVELRVSDTGSGIPAAELPHVFDRFHRVAGTKGRTHEGTGIGLALVQELVRLHGGAIEVTSEPGRGSTFVVSIPAEASAALHAGARLDADDAGPAGSSVPAGPNPYAEEAMRWLPDAAPARTSAPVARERLLVADDNADMREYLRRLLSPRWDVETVANGALALAALRARHHALLVTDVMMPELDGFGLTAAIRADPELRELPVIMLSARAGEEARVEGLQAGASDYLVKPFSSRDLVAHVETQLLRAAVRSVEVRHARRLEEIFAQAPVAIALLRGPEHVFELANPRYRELIGNRDIVGRSVAEALPEVVEQGIVALLDGVFRTGKPYLGKSMAVSLASATGALVDHYFDFIYQPTFDGDGRVSGIAVVVHDVTEVVGARRAAEDANRAKDEFLAMLGHELRNPLAPILTALQLMRLRANVGAERERGVIERQVKQLVGLVDDLLDVSRITRGKVELHPEAVEISHLVARAIEIVSPLYEEHRHRLDVEVTRGQYVRGDVARLTQVLSNLLTNAAKYTPDGGRIRVSSRREGDTIALAVADNGVGIDAAMLGRVFEAFAQAPQSVDRAKGGLGLGLAIVENLVKLHGGQVSAASGGLGRGSEFVVRLPALEPGEAPAVPAAGPPTPAPASSGRVLIVDDNVDAAEMLAGVLEADGYTTRTAFDGPEALAAAAEFRPQVAVLDIGLPVMDGYEVAERLRGEASLAPLQLVAVTGYGQARDRERTGAAGFAAHLVKPVDLQKLREVIEALLPAKPAPPG